MNARPCGLYHIPSSIGGIVWYVASVEVDNYANVVHCRLQPSATSIVEWIGQITFFFYGLTPSF